jgi:hypothetical protein
LVGSIDPGGDFVEDGGIAEMDFDDSVFVDFVLEVVHVFLLEYLIEFGAFCQIADDEDAVFFTAVY